MISFCVVAGCVVCRAAVWVGGHNVLAARHAEDDHPRVSSHGSCFYVPLVWMSATKPPRFSSVAVSRRRENYSLSSLFLFQAETEHTLCPVDGKNSKFSPFTSAWKEAFYLDGAVHRNAALSKHNETLVVVVVVGRSVGWTRRIYSRTLRCWSCCLRSAVIYPRWRMMRQKSSERSCFPSLLTTIHQMSSQMNSKCGQDIDEVENIFFTVNNNNFSS